MSKSVEYMDGWHAHSNKVSSGENPYDKHKQSYSYNQWDCGWGARFNAIKQGRELMADRDEGFNS